MPGPLKEMKGAPDQLPTTCARPPPSEWPQMLTGRPKARSFAHSTMAKALPAMLGMTFTPMRTLAEFWEMGAVVRLPLVPEKPTITSSRLSKTPPW